MDWDQQLELTTNTVTQYVQEDAQMLARQSTICENNHGNSGYLLRNIEVGTQEFAGTGNHVDDRQMRWTEESQLMRSCQGHTSQLHKQIAQTNHTKQDDVMSKNGMMNDALGCSRATQVLMEYLRLVNLTEICPITLQSSLLMLWMDENLSQQSNKNCWPR